MFSAQLPGTTNALKAMETTIVKAPSTIEQFEELGRVRLSRNFFMRDFLYSEIAAWHGILNIPDHPDVAIKVGRRLCEELLEPLQATFGRIAIRSAYRSPAVNEFGNRHRLNCASNEANFAAHIWDHQDAGGHHGAMACIVVPWLCDYMASGGDWRDFAWWVHDHLPYSKLCFFTKLGAFNIGWHERPVRRIDSFADPKGCLTRSGMANHEGSHADQYRGFPCLRTHDQPVATAASAAEWAGLPADASLPRATRHQMRSTAPSRLEESAARRAAAEFTAQMDESGSPGCVHYRAVHAKTPWRKVDRHGSIAAALDGKDGAVALFARKVRINYEAHGDPKFVLVWQEGASTGWIVRPDPEQRDGVMKSEVPAAALLVFERTGFASESEIEALCVKPSR